MYLTEKIKITPDRKALLKLWEVSNICTELWNAALEQRRDRKSWGKVNIYTQKKELPTLKKEFPFFRKPSSQVLQNVLFALDRSYKMFFSKWRQGDKEVRPPRFKSRRYFFTQEYSQKGVAFEIDGSLLRLSYGSRREEWIQIKLPDYKAGSDTIKSVDILYDRARKNWYACLTYTGKCRALKTEGHTLYFDPGCKTSLTGIKTDGTLWEYDLNPLRELNIRHYRLIDRLASMRDKKKRGSIKHRRLKARINSLYRKINTQTRHYLHVLANRILGDHPDVRAFMVGNWDKRKTLADTGIRIADKRINRQVQNNNPIQKLIGYLNYKAARLGVEVAKFDERGTIRTCSCCGHVLSAGLSPPIRVFACPVCGFTAERDINSVLNFLKRFNCALWQGLRAIASLSIARLTVNP